MEKIFIESSLLKELKVKYGFFTRNGCYSLRFYDSLNCKINAKDLIKNVEKKFKYYNSIF